ncbi:hypothetical protein FFWV33_06390 [Flavobacterium faecale]|uniref:Outer membrane protein beta-barrel domain-containing protein n=1 Tax=Flavobacterium faecale TaxID=1355330 RepID=A0A2S1LBR0_9FLAO|nr:outer membrane beta-barrel protein [Flavobacterium faecale]AWG21190.1 hypothetical protein FFWV33_06390 [Flavobacterium faecale]
MKQKLFLALVLLFTVNTFSQESKISLEANYPIAIGGNFVSEFYKGIIDIGAKYRIAETTNFSFGASINGGVLTNNTNKNKGERDFKVTNYTIQPRLFTEIKIKSLTKLHPAIGLGYTFMIFKSTGINNGFDLSKEDSIKKNGINANLGLSYDITNKLFTTIQYDYVKLSSKESVPSTAFNTSISFLKIGIGVRL